MLLLDHDTARRDCLQHLHSVVVFTEKTKPVLSEGGCAALNVSDHVSVSSAGSNLYHTVKETKENKHVFKPAPNEI